MLAAHENQLPNGERKNEQRDEWRLEPEREHSGWHVRLEMNINGDAHVGDEPQAGRYH
jgi:hypothetical protein